MPSPPVDARPPRTAGAVLLAAGIMALEFAAAVSSFVSSTLLPTVARDLHARNRLGLMLAGSALGLFVALPLAARVLHRLGPRGTLTAGLVTYLGGAVLSAVSRTAAVFAAGQFAAGLAGGLLAVFGISSAIRHLDEGLRVRVIAASSAMWILPALVGPAATLALEHLVGWRWTLLAPIPVVIVGRLLIVRAAREETGSAQAGRPLWRTLLIPLGVAALVLTGGHGAWWPVALLGACVAGVGVVSIMPAGTFSVRPGAPAALCAMLLFATGYFGADSLITVFLTNGYRSSLPQAAVVLGAAPLAWALTGLAAPRMQRRGRQVSPAVGLGLSSVGVAVLAGAPLVAPSFGTALVAWAGAGVGVGLAYPGLYLRSTPADAAGLTAEELAAAVITAEAFGGLVGRAAGGAAVSVGDAAQLPPITGLASAYSLFAAALLGAALAALRSAPRERFRS